MIFRTKILYVVKNAQHTISDTFRHTKTHTQENCLSTYGKKCLENVIQANEEVN